LAQQQVVVNVGENIKSAISELVAFWVWG